MNQKIAKQIALNVLDCSIIAVSSNCGGGGGGGGGDGVNLPLIPAASHAVQRDRHRIFKLSDQSGPGAFFCENP
ncbi:MAG TPA: hypothetical protein VM658_00655 [bacterium]|nr:hypothetical protein [bacterium]